MTSNSDLSQRRHWLLQTLHALRSYFDSAPPHLPDDMTDMEVKAEGLLISCPDPRNNDLSDLRIPRARLYNQPLLGSALHPPGWDKYLTALMDRVIKPALEDGVDRNIPIIGHPNCGANTTLLDTLLQPADKPLNAEAEIMLPMASRDLSDVIKKAADKGIPRKKLIFATTQSTVLQSVLNAIAYKGNTYPIAAMQSFCLDKTEMRYPVHVYDPDNKCFCSLEKLYDEAFPNNIYKSCREIEAAWKKAAHDEKPDKDKYTKRIQDGLSAVIHNIHGLSK